MKLFSNRNRPVSLGPYPLETLPRIAQGDLTPVAGGPGPLTPATPDTPIDGTLAPGLEALLALFESFADRDRIAERAEVTGDPRELADNLKASCYFLDASMVGICKLPDSARRRGDSPGAAGTPMDHTHAIVVLLAHSQEPAPGTLEAGWLRGCQHMRGDMRTMEIATTLAGYMRWLGYHARAHSISSGGVDQQQLVIAAGLGWRNPKSGEVCNPFVGTRYRTATVTTDMPLATDVPLKPPGVAQRYGPRAWAGWLGLNPPHGAPPGQSGGRRALHRSRYPMERIRRRKSPTTYRSQEIPRIPKRANFFVRVAHGDLGERPQAQRTRFAVKHPLVMGMGPLLRGMVPYQQGDVAPRIADGAKDPHANAQAVKAACHYLGADLTGICAAIPHAWYSHQENGEAIDPYHRNAVVILIDQGYETMEGASGDDWISGAQSMRAYMRSAEITNAVAAHIRSLGYAARSHTQLDSDVLHIPLILQAGLGELSRIGELVLNPFVGPRFKSAVITTDMPLAEDRPIDFGLQDFCGKCHKCARECPCDAIPWGDKVMFNGYEIWKPDVMKCVQYRVTNTKGSACGRCMKACPFNTEGLLAHRLFLWMAVHVPFTRKWIADLDDKVGNGTRNPVKRWWFDLEIVDGKAVRARGVNERDLNLQRKDNGKQRIAHFPFDMIPPPVAPDPVPVDRTEGLRRAQAAEKPPAPH